MNDEKIAAAIVDICKGSQRKMTACEIWYYNFDYYQIRFNQVERVYNKLKSENKI